jgi:hypothetical protein
MTPNESSPSCIYVYRRTSTSGVQPFLVYLPIGWVFHVEKEIKEVKSGKDEKLTCRP